MDKLAIVAITAGVVLGAVAVVGYFTGCSLKITLPKFEIIRKKNEEDTADPENDFGEEFVAGLA